MKKKPKFIKLPNSDMCFDKNYIVDFYYKPGILTGEPPFCIKLTQKNKEIYRYMER